MSVIPHSTSIQRTQQPIYRPYASTMTEALSALKQREQLNKVVVETDEAIEWLEAGDTVRIERLVCRADAPPEYGTLVQTQPDIQWGLVRFAGSTRMEWFHIDELYLEQKAASR